MRALGSRLFLLWCLSGVLLLKLPLVRSLSVPLPHSSRVLVTTSSRTGQLVWETLLRPKHQHPLWQPVALVESEANAQKLLNDVPQTEWDQIVVYRNVSKLERGLHDDDNAVPPDLPDSTSMIICTNSAMPREGDCWCRDPVATANLATKIGVEHVVVVAESSSLIRENVDKGLGDRDNLHCFLEDTGLNYTILYADQLTETPTGMKEFVLTMPSKDSLVHNATFGSISRADVADLCVAALSLCRGEKLALQCRTKSPSNGTINDDFIMSAAEALEIFMSERREVDNSESEVSLSLPGLVVLCSVPLVWGTYVPIVRLLYEIDPPIPGYLFSTAYFATSALTTSLLVQILGDGPRAGDSLPSKDFVNQNFDRVKLWAGTELGSWLFFGNTLQILGLKTVPSDRAGFLVQLTTILVPLVSALLAGNLFAIDSTTWLACLIALAGIVVMNVDLNHLGATAGAIVLSSGDLYILGSALMYTMHVIRLGEWAPLVPPLQLAASKSTIETFLSAGLVVVSVAVAGSLDETPGISNNLVLEFLKESGNDLLSFCTDVLDRLNTGSLSSDFVVKSVGATLWAGWVVTAYAIFAQSYGQQRVGPSEANLIYSLQPIFTTIFAYFLLGETMDASGFLGGIMILSAVILVASQQGPGSAERSAKKTKGQLLP